MSAPNMYLTVGAKAALATNPGLAADLGNLFVLGSKTYRLVKAAGTLTTIGRAALVTALDGTTKLPTWIVTTTTTANDCTIVGVCDSTQVNVVVDDFLLIQVAGPAEVISAAAIVASKLVGTSTTAKKCDDASVVAGEGQFAISLESAAGADENVAVRLIGLI